MQEKNYYRWAVISGELYVQAVLFASALVNEYLASNLSLRAPRIAG